MQADPFGSFVVFTLILSMPYFVLLHVPQAAYGIACCIWSKRFHTDETGFPTDI